MSSFYAKLTKKQKSFVRALPWLVVAAILLYAASAGISDKQFQWLQPPEWSRGKLVGETAVRETAVLATDDANNAYLLLFPGNATTQDATLLALDPSGNELWETTLASNLALPSLPKLLWHNSQLTAFWLLDEAIHKTVVDTAGNIVEPTTVLEFPVPINHYDTAVSRHGIELWAGGSRTNPSIYVQTGSNPAELIDANGQQPLLQVDENGDLHAVWSRFATSTATIVYGGRTAASSWLEMPAELIQIDTGSGARIRGPWFTLENGRGYLAWSTEFLAGLSAGQTLSQYVTFSLEQEANATPPADFKLPYGRQRDYPQAAGALQAGNRIPLVDTRGRQASPLDGHTLVSSLAAGQESVLALRVSVEHLKQKQASQIALYYLDDGAPNGYQLLTFSSAGSMHPALAITSEGDLLVSWLERGQGSGINVYFAGTTPTLQTAFSRLTAQDYGLFILETLFGMLQSASFAPFSLLFWAGVPLVFLALTGWLRKREYTWRHPTFLVPLVTAVLIFWIAKYITLRDALWYVPFSAWIPIIPDWFGLPLQILTPLIVTILAAYLAWNFSYKRQRESILLLFLIYAGVDTILSMSIYGGILYNAL